MIKNLKMKKSAFTLVELLVVIAIIGLLSTIVLVSFGPIRNTASDTAIKANMNQMRLAAEMEYSDTTPNSYAATGSRPDYSAALTAVEEANGTSSTVIDEFSADAYCVQSALPGGGTWCIDSTGYIGGDTDHDECDATAESFDCLDD
jgi:prepilin-type N-terminal cleavage/methylation domain-containing protein